MIGRVRRVEDPRLLRGQGRYVGDIRLPGQLEVAFLRSPHAHARLLGVDARRAREMPGVVAVLTGEEAVWMDGALTPARSQGAALTPAGSRGRGATAPLPLDPAGVRAPRARPLQPRLGIPTFKACDLPCLATDRVRFVGQAIAAVVAEDRYQAEDAAELIEVDYNPLPAITDARRALDPDAPLLHDAWGDNLHVESSLTAGDPDGAFATADFVVSRHFRTGRYTGVPMETRGVLASFEPASGELTVWSSTQVPHLLRTLLADVLDFPEHRLRVIAPDVGGGFGIKAPIYPEEVAVALLALRLGRPVRWLEDRREHLTAATHARQQDLQVEAAADRDGNLLAVRFDLVGDAGAYSCYPFTSAIETLQTARHLPGPYRLRNYQHRTRAAVTNKSPVGPCRAVSRPVGSLVMETLFDLIAERTGLDPAEVRRRNLVQPDELPYTSITNQTYDSGSYVESLDRLLEMVDYPAFRRVQAEARAEGRYLGLGIANYVEHTAQGSPAFAARGMDNLAGYESANLRVDPSGKVLVAVGVSDHGQAHRTTLAQLAAQEVGVPLEDVLVVEGDTARTPYGMGTFTSRSAVCGGGAVVRAAGKLRPKLLAIAGHLLEAEPADLELRDGRASVRGAPDRSVTFREIARVAYYTVTRLPAGLEPELEATAHYDAGFGTYSNGAHAALVDVDPETGLVRFLKYWVVEDCGTMLNPTVVAGQVHGGVAQGIGGAAYEELVYGDDGQLLSASFMDYLVPTSAEVPPIEVAHLVTPSPHTPLGIKGMGEGGTVCPGSVLASAVADALGVRFTELPITPEKVRAAIRARAAAPR